MSEQDEGVIRITEEDLKKPAKPDITITEEDVRKAEESEIKITEKDLEALEQPEIKITHRDVARNPKVKTLHQDARWWGRNKEGKQRLAEYQRAEKEREGFEKLLEEIVILPDKPWSELTDRELSGVEIEITQEDIAAMEKEDLSPEEKARRDKEAWDSLVKERKEFFDSQKTAIQTMYAGRSLQTPIIMETHMRQRYVGQEGIWSCAVASTLNALHALGAARPEDSEDSIIREMGGREVFAEDGYLPIGRADDFLKSRNLVVTPSGNIIELLQTLENGGVAVIAYGGHARMISGAEVANGEVSLKVHDPLNRTQPERISTDDLMEGINQTRRYYNMLLIENISTS